VLQTFFDSDIVNFYSQYYGSEVGREGRKAGGREGRKAGGREGRKAGGREGRAEE